MLPSPTELKYFLEVSDTLNLSRAAERLGVSQPTLSLAIKRLEEAFGTALLMRGKNGVQLTHAGQKLVSRTRSLLEDWERIRKEAVTDEKEVRGRYTIGCHPSVGLFTLPNLLPELLAKNPSLEIKLVHDLSRKITESIVSFKIDFGIVVNPTRHPDLIIRDLWKDEVTLWTAKNPGPLQSTTGDGVLLCDTELVQSQTLLKQLDRSGFSFKRIVESSSLDLIAALVVAGVGIGILPGRVAARLESKGIRPVKGAPKYIDHHALVYRADVQNSVASRTLAKNIESILLS